MTNTESQTRQDRFCCKLTSGPPWQGCWWLLDVETNGLNRQENDIIALRLARMEGYKTIEEREILVCPRRPSSPWAEQLTGISNRELEQAAPLEEALEQLESANASDRLLLYDRDFTVPFLENAYDRCGREFRLDYLPLDRLAERLGASGPKRIGRLLETLPPPPASWPYAPPRNHYLEQLYRLALALFGKLAVTYDVHDTAQFVRLFELEE